MQRQLPQGVVTYNALSKKLLAGLTDVARSALPEGCSLTPFGSYIQGTCLPGSALDVALVTSGTEDSDGQMTGASDVVETLGSALLHRTTAFAEPEPTSTGAGSEDGPMRLLVGDFAEGRQSIKHEVALHLGDASTGRLDGLLRRLLDTDPRAPVFVMLVKHWAQSRCLTGPPAGGSFQWALLAVFVLQHEGVLPALREFCAGGVTTWHLGGGSGNPAGAPSGTTAMDHPGAMLLRFAEVILGHAEKPAPRPRICLWTGSFVDEPADTPAHASCGDFAAVAGQDAPYGEQFVQELRRLQGIFRADAAACAYSLAAFWQQEPSSAAPAAVPAAAPAGAADPAEGAAGGEAAAPPSSSGRAGFTTPPHSRRRGAWPLPPIHEAGGGAEDASWAHSLEPPRGRIPEFPLPHLGGGPGEAGTASAQGGLRWRIDENWIATCSREGNIVDAVQLDPELGVALGRTGWERRIARRLHQIRIGKATKEYRRWQEHFRRHGHQPGDPVTPRAVVQSSKKQFETDYAEWRIQLHKTDFGTP